MEGNRERERERERERGRGREEDRERERERGESMHSTAQHKYRCPQKCSFYMTINWSKSLAF